MRILRWIGWLMGVLIATAALLAFLVAFYPAPFLRVASTFLERTTPVRLSFGTVSGRLTGAVAVTELSLKFPGGSAEVARLELDLGWRALLGRTVLAERLIVDRPRITLEGKRRKEPRPDNRPGASSWRVAGTDVRLTDGRVSFPASSPLGVAGGIDFSGSIQQNDWRLSVAVQDVPPEVLISTPPAFIGSLSGHLDARGTGFDPATLTADGTAAFRLAGGPAVNGGVSVRSGTVHFDVDLSRVGLAGAVEGSWSPATQAVEATVDLRTRRAPLLRWTGVAGADGRLTATVTGSIPEIAWDGVLALERATVSKRTVDAVRIESNGTLGSHAYQLTARTSDYALNGEGRGTWDGQRWTGVWSSFRARILYDFQASRPFTTRFGSGAAVVQDLRLKSGPRRIEVDLDLEGDTLRTLRADTRGFSLSLLSELGLVSFPLQGRVSGRAELSGPVKTPTGTFSASATDVTMAGEAVGSLEARGRLSEERIVLDHLGVQAPGGTAVVSATVSVRSEGRRLPPLEVRLRTERFDPSVFARHLAGVEFSSSSLSADLSISAARGRFSADGWLLFTATGAVVTGPSLRFRDVRLDLAADGRILRVRAARAAGVDGGELIATGDVSEDGFQMDVRAGRLRLKAPERGFDAVLDAATTLRGAWDQPTLTGTIKILKATLTKPRKKPDAPDESAPVPEAPRPAPDDGGPLAMDVAVEFDRDVWYRDGESAIEFSGDLRIKKEPAFDARLFGTVQTVRGEYIFYGRSFEIEQGVVTFVGRKPLDPALDIRAIYVSDQTRFRVILGVTGTLRQPKVSMTSEPPLDETDIISVLVTGAPMGQGGAGDTATAERARLLAANYLAEKVRQRLQTGFDIDVLRFNVASEGQTALTVGENITEDLYISYGQTLAPGGERRVEAEYTLTPRWSLQGYTTNVGRYVIDLLFRFGFR